MKMFDTPIHTNDQSLDRVLAAGLPVLLIFLDGPASHGLVQEAEKIAKENSGKMLVAKISKRDNPAAISRFQIGQTPALAAIRSGNLLAKAEGINPADLVSYSNYLLGKGPQPARRQDGPQGETHQAPPEGNGVQRAAGDGRPVPVTDANFDQVVLKSSLPVLVDFWAPWCGPCRMTEPILDKMATEMTGRLIIAKMNVDENPYTAQQYGIQSIPTMMIVRNGKIIDRWVGALSEPALKSRVMAAI
jgi:thioredoxin 1